MPPPPSPGRLQGVVSDEFATGIGLVPLTAPMMLNEFPAGANLASTGEGILGAACVTL